MMIGVQVLDFLSKLLEVMVIPTADASVDVHVQVVITFTGAHPSQNFIGGYGSLVTAFDASDPIMCLLSAVQADTYAKLGVLVAP
tara:strand:- start:842 stop:1096 length:255 start_codon:yes stop_codon:yes gene_type:complete